MTKVYNLLNVVHTFGVLENGNKYQTRKVYFAVDVVDNSGTVVQRFTKEYKVSSFLLDSDLVDGLKASALHFDDRGKLAGFVLCD